jgi:Tol biopolymer transport system component
MTAHLPLETVVTDWLRDDAPEQAPSTILEVAMDRVTGTRQERYLAQRLFGDALGRSPQVRFGLAAVLSLLALAGAVVVAGTLWPKQPPAPFLPVVNGAVVVAANGRAGADLAIPIVEPRNPESDLYLVTSDGPERIVGTDDDTVSQTCPAFSPDGTLLAYREVAGGGTAPTPAPVPAGTSPSPTATPSGPGQAVVGSLVIVPVDRSGRPIGDGTRIPIPVSDDTYVACPLWSPDGRHLAFTTDPPKDVWLVTSDGRSTRMPAPPNLVNDDAVIAWSPDGRTIAYPYDDRLWFLPIDGAPPTSIVTGQSDAVAWLPDGQALLVVGEAASHVVTRDGRELLTVPTQGRPVLSPDGRTLASVVDGRLELVALDGSKPRRIPVDPGVLGGKPVDSIVSWSPDGSVLLIGVGDPLGITALVSVPVATTEPARVLIRPTLALGGGTSWQALHP